MRLGRKGRGSRGKHLFDGQRQRLQRRGVRVRALHHQPLVERLQHAPGGRELLVVERRDERLDEVGEGGAVERRAAQRLGARRRVEVLPEVVAVLQVAGIEGRLWELAEGSAVEVRLRQPNRGGVPREH